MLSRAVYYNRMASTSMFASSVLPSRSITTSNKNYIEPTHGLKDLVDHMDKTRPTYSCLYFTASWNPKCAEIERDYEKMCQQNPEFNHVRVDCD